MESGGDESSLERDWEDALDAADEAVQAAREAGTLEPADAAAETAHVREERQWFGGLRSSLRRLVVRTPRDR